MEADGGGGGGGGRGTVVEIPTELPKLEIFAPLPKATRGLGRPRRLALPSAGCAGGRGGARGLREVPRRGGGGPGLIGSRVFVRVGPRL